MKISSISDVETLRGVANLKARALKELWNVEAEVPIERGITLAAVNNNNNNNNNWSNNSSRGYCEKLVPEKNFDFNLEFEDNE